LTLKPTLSAEELDALLSSPPSDNVKVDAYFPLRIWILVAASAFWFVRLSVFTSEVAADLFSNPAVREFMVPALYFRAWVVIVSITVVLWSYKNTKFPAIAFGFIFVASIFNLFFDISVEWHPKLSHFEENLHPNLSHPNRLSCLIFEQGWARSDQRGNFEQITQTCPSRQGLHPTS